MAPDSPSGPRVSRVISAPRPGWLALAPVIFLLLWSGGYVFAKIGLRDATPMALLCLRYGVVVILMAALFALMRPALPRRPADWGHLAFVGFPIQVVYFGLSYLAFSSGVSAGTVALIMSLQPILVALIAPLWTRERVGARRWLGLFIALAGTVVVIISRSALAPPSWSGLLLTTLGLFGMTAATLWEKRFGRPHHPVTANLVGYAAGLLGVLPMMLAFETPAVHWSASFIGALAYLVVGNSLIALGLLLAMVRAGAVSRVSALLFLVPPMAALFAWMALDEAMPPAAWLGLAIAGAGVYVATREPRTTRP
ncbi:MAG: DMT family transporter [Burkholderiaceae bacterium]